MTSHWGELPVVTETEAGIAAMEREQMMKVRAMDLEGPRLHQPSSRHHPPSLDTLPAEKFEIPPLTLHTIQLVQHARTLRTRIHNLQQQDKNLDLDTDYPDAPPVPQYTGPPPVRHTPQGPLSFLPKDLDSDFVRGIGDPHPKIDDISCRHLLRKSVAALLAHAGYDSCAESVLETLTDVTQEFYLQFTKHLRVAADNLAAHEPNGFPDIVEQVFHEMGLGSVTCLHDFYQSRVINYRQHLEEQCQQLCQEYEKLKEPILQQQKQPDTLSVIRIKEEPSEIHFPELDEIEVNDAEQLLNLENLGGFEITVEHESASGLTTEVESKWSAVKSEAIEQKVRLDQFGEVMSVKHEAPASSSSSSSEAEDSLTGPPSIPVSDLMSPGSMASKPKKMKRS